MPAVQRINGHSPYEPLFGFSRAVVTGGRVLVSGTAPVPATRTRPHVTTARENPKTGS